LITIVIALMGWRGGVMVAECGLEGYKNGIWITTVKSRRRHWCELVVNYRVDQK